MVELVKDETFEEWLARADEDEYLNEMLNMARKSCID